MLIEIKVNMDDVMRTLRKSSCVFVGPSGIARAVWPGAQSNSSHNAGMMKEVQPQWQWGSEWGGGGGDHPDR